MSSFSIHRQTLVPLCSVLSLLFSFAALLLVLKEKSFISQERPHPEVEKTLLSRHTRGARSATLEECHDENTPFQIYDDFRTASLKIRELKCRYRDMQEQLDNKAYDFGAVVYFINEIGVNMNAAKTQIETNQEDLQLLKEESRSLENSTHLELRRTFEENLSSFELKLNETKQHLIEQIHEEKATMRDFQNQVRLLETAFGRLGDRINRLERHQRVNEPTFTPKTVTSNSSSHLKEAVRKNFLMIGIYRNALTDLQSELARHASEGWFNAPNGYQYFLSKNAFRTNAYVRSRRYCTNRNSDLAYVGMRDPDVFRYLWINLIGPSRHQCVWFGLSDLGREGFWKWMDGKDVGMYWTHWAVGRPARGSVNEDCAMIRAGLWVDGHCSGLRRLCSFICERRIF